jgi:hypothetical protein
MLIFNISFWLVAAIVLFVNSWSNATRHMDVAIARYLYLIVIGLLVTSALILNPITYLMAGVNIHTVPHEILSTGTLYFALFYFVWSVLYFQLSSRSILGAALPQSHGQDMVFKVEKMGEKRLLHDRDICCVNASGDYVELVTAVNSYLKKETLSKLESQLDKSRFRRVHRSTIINTGKIESVVQKPGGTFEIRLEGGHIVHSSRSYKAIVESILPQA